MNNPYSREVMAARFAELGEQIKQIEETSPRKERDEKFETLTVEQLANYKVSIRQHEEGLYDLKQEYASLARALGARRG